MIEAIQDNPLGWLSVFERLPGARRNGRSVVTDLDHPLCNSIVFPDDGVDVERELAYGVPRLWWVGPRSPSLCAALEARSVEGEEEPAMALRLDAVSDVPAALGIRIDEVSGARLRDFAGPFGTAFELPPEIVTHLIAAMVVSDADLTHYVAYTREGMPVATASVLFHAGVAGLYNIGTLPSHARRGIGTAITARALERARERGCDTAILHASPTGYPIYLRLGFERLATVRTFVTR